MDESKQTRSVHIPSRIWQTNALITLLKDRAKEGTVMTRKEIEEATNVEVESPKGQGRLRSALRHLERNEDIVWTNLRGQGAIQCMNTSGKLESTAGILDGVRRGARRASIRLSTVDTRKLDQGEKVTYAARVAIAQAVEGQLAPKAIRPPKIPSTKGSIAGALAGIEE